MKKIIGAALMAALSIGFVFAEEGAKTIGKPSFEAKNTLTVVGATDEYGDYALDGDEMKNELEAKFSVGFKINDMFSIKPYISNKAVFKTVAMTASKDTLKAGLKFKITPAEMFGVSIDLAYLTEFGKNKIIEIPSSTPGGAPKKIGPDNTNGVSAGVGFNLELENFFLSWDVLKYGLEAKFAKFQDGDNSKDVVKKVAVKHKISTDLTFDFFNFIKDGLNSGLVLSNETKISGDTVRKMDDSSKKAQTKKLENDFSIGLHFNPVEYLDFKFVTNLGYSQEGAEKGFSDSEWSKPEKTTKIGLGLGLVLTHNNFFLEAEYTPVLKTKIVNAKGEVTNSKAKEHEHECKIAVGFNL